CSLLETGVVAIVGPTSGQASEQVRSVCEYFAVPHIETNWNYRLPRPNHYTVNLSPHFETYSQALSDYIKTMVPATRTAVIYDDPDSLLKFEGLLNAADSPVLVRQWAKRSGTYKYVMKELRAARISRFLVDIPVKKLVRFMIIAKEMNMTSEYNSYIFTAWDVNRVDLSDFQVIRGSNFSTLTLLPSVPPDAKYDRGPIVEQMRNEIYRAEREKRDYSSLLFNMLPTAAATLFDSIMLLASGLNQLTTSQVVRPQRLSCQAPRQEMWTAGPSLLNFMRSMPGDIAQQTLTGPVTFDGDWKRVNFSLYAYELTASGFSELGKWHSLDGFNLTKRFEDTKEEYIKILQNRTLRVTTVAIKNTLIQSADTNKQRRNFLSRKDAPFVKIKETDEKGVPLPHPSAWDGFCIDMLNLIAQQVGFNYTVHLVKDGNYGAVNGSNEDGRETWNGMIGELINHEADLAIASLTITYERERVIDFTTPYMSLGLSIMFKRPEKSKPHLFSFLQPLSVPVWGYMLAAYVIVSFVLFVVARVSPYEWQNPHPCEPDNNEVENQFSLLNSLWFNAGSLMQQGSEISPRALSTRLISGIWWFFTLIMISSYTANLAAFLTVERMQSPIESAEDLAKQTKIKYGTLYGGSTYQFFKRAKIEVFRKMWNYMSKRPEVFVNRTGDGIARVKQGGYAFILESTMNEYYAERNCDLMRVGGLLDSKGYGIGLPTGKVKGCTFGDIVVPDPLQGSQARPTGTPSPRRFLKFQKEQDLENLRRKWWREMDIQTRCEDVAPDSQGPAGLGIDQVAGVYVVLAIGTAVGVLVMAMEFGLKFMKRADED
uniref:PBPe domain-containing protein n=1 Tax=Macrostomum lignano TaxID=282301 RepID=A0A1I8G515_9PLAT